MLDSILLLCVTLGKSLVCACVCKPHGEIMCVRGCVRGVEVGVLYLIYTSLSFQCRKKQLIYKLTVHRAAIRSKTNMYRLCVSL